jgi:transketolase
MYKNKEMRAVMASELDKIMEQDKSVVILDADLAGACGTKKLYEKYPERTFNVGVAEANMAGIAAGLAAYGFTPFIFTFCPFATRRICDQVTISIAYAKQNVKIVGTDPGVSAQLNGGTHMSVEDVGVMRSIPTMVIFEPVDNVQLAKALPQIVSYKGPIYIRLFRKLPPMEIFNYDHEFDLFKADILKEGSDITILASGIEVKEALEAAQILKDKGIRAEVINVHTIKPLDEETILNSVKKTGCVLTCENHNIIGGLGSAVSELLGRNYPAPVEMIGIKDHFSEVGMMPPLIKKFQMDSDSIVAAAEKCIKRK